LHLLVYPASNAYNSYFDKDEGSIGGLKNPPKVDKKLWHVANALDLLAFFICAFFIHLSAAFFVLVYILISRAYSYPGIRLKKYPLLSWLTVGLIQGAYVYFLVYSLGQKAEKVWPFELEVFTALLLSSCLLLGVYPITQIYQHEADRKAGDMTMSRMLGINGTFYNCFAFFGLSVLLAFLVFEGYLFILFMAFGTPALVFLVNWYLVVQKDSNQANFKRTMAFNTVSSLFLNLCFILIYLLKTAFYK
jgi:4-hydroxybenzoate polyprenyltransferase